MGEVKINLEIIRQDFIKMMERWAQPTCSEETLAIEEISCLPAITVRVADAAFIEWCRMVPNECHDNCRFMSENDPVKQTYRILGWIICDDGYICHSIINQVGQNLCVTPNGGSSTSFRFIPDKSIIEVDNGLGFLVTKRKGLEIFNGLRFDPEKIIKDALRCRELLLTDMDPYEAMKSFKFPPKS